MYLLEILRILPIVLCFILSSENLMASDERVFTDRADDLEEGFVRVRVWNSAVGGGEHYGHVSVETRSSYISLWPTGSERVEIPGVGALMAKAIGLKSYVKDREAEGRDPEEVHVISLDVKNIDDAWGRMKSNADEVEDGYVFRDIMWYAAGAKTALDGYLGVKTEEKILFSCATMAMTMLKHGGIDQWLSITAIDILKAAAPFIPSIVLPKSATYTTREFINNCAKALSTLLTPDEVGNIVKQAKIKQTLRTSSEPRFLSRYEHFSSLLMRASGLK